MGSKLSMVTTTVGEKKDLLDDVQTAICVVLLQLQTCAEYFALAGFIGVAELRDHQVPTP